MNKTLYMLIGPKGSGKTYIGQLIGNQTNISFLRVENIWLSLKPKEDGWLKVENAIWVCFRLPEMIGGYLASTYLYPKSDFNQR